MSNLDIRILADKFQEAKEAKKYELALTACKIAVTIENILSYRP